jgi:hypothetical protein
VLFSWYRPTLQFPLSPISSIVLFSELAFLG